jgi:hypothetical protein
MPREIKWLIHMLFQITKARLGSIYGPTEVSQLKYALKAK